MFIFHLFTSVFPSSEQGVLEHSVNVGLDLRKLGFSPEFGLQAKGEVSQQRPPRYTVDLHVFKDENKYHLHAHNTPEHGSKWSFPRIDGERTRNFKRSRTVTPHKNYDQKIFKIFIKPNKSIGITPGARKIPYFRLIFFTQSNSTKLLPELQNGITITLPQRVLAYDMLLTYPTQGTPFPIKADVTLNLDKNKPQLKSAFRMLIDHHGSEKGHNAVAEFGFSHPKLGKVRKLSWFILAYQICFGVVNYSTQTFSNFYQKNYIYDSVY